MGVLLSWAWRTVDNSSVTVFAWHFLVHSSTTPAPATTAKKDKQICGDQLSEIFYRAFLSNPKIESEGEN